MMRRKITASLLTLLSMLSLPLSVLAATPSATSFSTAVTVSAQSIIQLQGSDPDGTPLTFATTSAPTHGALSQSNTATGAIIYTPTFGYTGADSFTYTVSSGGDTSSAATVSIIVTGAKTRIVDTLTNPDDSPRVGKVSFILTQATSSPSGLIPAKSSVSAQLTAQGQFDVSIYPSRAVNPIQFYQVWFEDSTSRNSQLLGVYDIPAASAPITLAGHRITDANLSAQYVFASRAEVDALTQAVAAATTAQLYPSLTAGKHVVWNGATFANSNISESGGTTTVTGNEVVTGTVAASGYTGIRSQDVPSTLNNKTLNNSTLASPVITGDSTQNGNATFNGNATVTGDLTAARLHGNCADCTGIGATGGPINTGSTTIGADSDSVGGGFISFQTRNGTERLQITNDGRLTGSALNSSISVFNIQDYGATPNDTTNDSAAWQATFNAAAAISPLRTAVIDVPEGQFRLTGAVVKDFSNLKTDIVLQGRGSGSQLFIDNGGSADAFTFANLNQLVVRDIAVIGHVGGGDDARRVFSLNSVWQAQFDRVNFYGVAATVAGGGVIYTTDTNLTITNSNFRGCVAGSAGDPSTLSGVINSSDPRGLTVDNVQFPDYGYLNGVYYSKTPVATSIWINVLNAAAHVDAFLTQGPILIRNVQMDEGQSNAIRIVGGATKFDNVELSHVRANIGVSTGFHIDGARRVKISDAWSNYTAAVSPNRDAVYLANVDSAEIERGYFGTYSSTIQAASSVGVLRVVNSVYTGGLNSAAARTEEVVEGATTRVYLRGSAVGRTSASGEAIFYQDATTGKVRLSENGGAYRNLLGGSSDTVLADDFASGTRDAAKWDVVTSTGMTISQPSGVLQVTTTAFSGSGISGYQSHEAYDFRENAAASVHVVNAPIGPGGGASVFTEFVTLGTSGDYFSLRLVDFTNSLEFTSSVGGVTATSTLASYEPATMGWWRIRYSGATMYGDTSPDGIAWTNRFSRASVNPATLVAAKQQILLYADSNTTGSYSAQFDNASLVKDLPPVLTDDGKSAKVAGDVEVIDSAKGIILKAPSGTRYHVTVSDAGALVVTALP